MGKWMSVKKEYIIKWKYFFNWNETMYGKYGW